MHSIRRTNQITNHHKPSLTKQTNQSDDHDSMNSLPDHVLVHILCQVPIRDLLQAASLVCGRFHELTEIAVERCKSLHLIHEDTLPTLVHLRTNFALEFNNYLSQFDVTSKLKLIKLDLLYRSMPCLARLSFACPPEFVDPILLPLMKQYHLKLTHLRIFIYNRDWNRFTYPDIQTRNAHIRHHAWASVFTLLNSVSFPKLTHLTIYDPTRHEYYPKDLVQLDLLKLSNLTELNFGLKSFALTCTVFEPLKGMTNLNRFAILYSMSLEHFELHHQRALSDALLAVTSNSNSNSNQTPLSHRLNHLTLRYQSPSQNNETKNAFLRFLSTANLLPSLRHLNIRVTNIPLEQLISSLQHGAPCLSDLHLDLVGEQALVYLCLDLDELLFYHQEENVIDYGSHAQLKQLTSLVFTSNLDKLNALKSGFNSTIRPSVEHHFPALRRLVFENVNNDFEKETEEANRLAISKPNHFYRLSFDRSVMKTSDNFHIMITEKQNDSLFDVNDDDDVLGDDLEWTSTVTKNNNYC